ncbi:hypothetical protein C2845_PM15G00970 [Panicum miliaceum]|uniref:Uncharacterized protein n=1 Tax=Panicum miliaceum TaxID=4540 RepID=A0A3L6Q980_PANMI|nr:hypothetical protein C2845_PM15G00970 [Panicum miliaceum]
MAAVEETTRDTVPSRTWSAHARGRNPNPNTQSCRTGCKAMVRLLRTADHGWYISMVRDTHNHRLSQSYEESKQWNSHSEIDGMTKEFIRRLRENNVTIGKVCSILGVTDGSSRLPMRKETICSLCAKFSQESMKDDIGKTLHLLDKMKGEDPGVCTHFQLDQDGRIRSMLWCTGKNRADYNFFGDVVTFDTTYRTNLYNLQFGIFVGVNNHFQSVIFGGVLLTSEKTEDFEWAFSNFVSIMSDRQPATILTGDKVNLPCVPLSHHQTASARKCCLRRYWR